jgi:HD-GYP domain
MRKERRSRFTCAVYRGKVAAAEADTGPWEPVDELLAGRIPNEPAVLIADASMLDHAAELLRLPRHVIIVAADQESERALGRRVHISLAGVPDPAGKDGVLGAACELARARVTSLRRWRQVASVNHELRELIRIGMALMSEHDLDALLRQILDVGKRFTESDGCGLFLTETDEGDLTRLRLAMYSFDSLPHLSELAGRLLPADNKSIIGYAAMSGEPVVLDDAYNLPPDAKFTTTSDFDDAFGYHRRSVLVVPMIDHLDHGVGVLVFFNRKSSRTAIIRTKRDADRFVLSYSPSDVDLARALAGQAAVSIENARLYEQLEQLFESFVKASVSAIDERDPTTSGHSVRVATLATELAGVVDRAATGPYRDVRFTRTELRELRLAALVHDFGKVGVHEHLLIKAKKLPPSLWERIDARFDLIRRTMELEDCRNRAAGRSPARSDLIGSDDPGRDLVERIAELERLRRLVAQANEPTAFDAVPNAELLDIAARMYERPDGTMAPYLTQEELHYLQVSHGTLDEQERAGVQAHVDQTNRFVSQIPWTRDLEHIADYAYGHHERLNGSGYPRGLRGDEIPLQTRMIAIADMFDALTEGDRPYKPAVSAERALDILAAEAREGSLDAELVRLLIDSQAYRRILDEDWRQL